MKIFLNGESREVGDALNLAEILVELNLANRALAIAVNQEIIPRSKYASTVLQSEDQVELVQAVGGG